MTILILIVITVLMTFRMVVLLLDVTTLSLKVVKNKDVSALKNKLEKNYQFIKGLY